MAEVPQVDRFYKGGTLWKWFGISSAVFLLVTVWMVFDDFARPWKGYQREFLQIKQRKIAEQMKTAQEELDADAVAAAKEKLASVENDLKAKEDALDKLKSELSKLKAKEVLLDSRWRLAKAKWDVRRYEFEAKYGHKFAEHREEALNPEAAKAEQKVRDELNKAYELRDKSNTATRAVEAKEAEIDGLMADKKTAEKELSSARGQLDMLEKAKEESQFTLTKLIQSSPIMDLANPVFRIQQTVVPTIRDDVYFAQVQKVDRCTTCHQAIDSPGFEDQPNPFKTHPRLDVMLGGSSPHPLNKIGCTVCHDGRGQAVDFNRAAHTPRNEEQEKQWKKKYGWHEEHHIIEKMLPLQYTEGKCVTCHKHTEYVPKGQKVNQAKLLVRNAGCFGCHRIEGWDHMRKPAPSLERVKGKLSKDWIVKWLEDPTKFNEHTRMPKVFHLENVESETFKKYQDAELTAVADYLLEESETYSPNISASSGNSETGKQLFGELGCLGCHNIDDYRLEGTTQYGRAPDLSTVGSKVSRNWLASWLTNPRHYWAKTTMPSLRLSPSEVGHLSAYLMSKRNQEFEEKSPVTGDLAQQKEVLKLYLARDPKIAPVTEEALGKAMSEIPDNKVAHELGKRAIGRYGCYGCHDIKGFEGVQGIGTELSDWGAKLVKKLDFGHLDVERTKHHFLEQKLKSSRSYDRGTVKEYLDLLRMPQYSFSDEDRESVVLLALGLTGMEVRPPAERILTAREGKIEQGYRVVHQYNCQGCHIMEGIFQPLPDTDPHFEEHEKTRLRVEGQVLAHYEDETLGPPKIVNEGYKVKSPWVHKFIERPFVLRGRLKVRMPSYNMPNSELNTLVEGWANEGNVEFPYLKEEKVSFTPERLAQARKLFNTLQCLNCHVSGEKLSAAALQEGSRGLAPDFWLAHERLHKDWIANFLDNPQQWIPGTGMPGFWPGGVSAVPDVLGGDSEAQRKLLADYLYYLGQNKLNR